MRNEYFLGLLIIVCVIILAIYYVIDRNDGVSDLPMATYTAVDEPYPIKDDKGPDEQSADSGEKLEEPERPDELEKSNGIQNIDPIIDNAYTIAPIEDSLYEIGCAKWYGFCISNL